MKAKPETIDDYLAPLSSDKRAALEKLRRAIQSAAPRAEECISYQIPAFRLGGKLLVGFGAGANHCAFYPGSRPLEAHRADLQGYDTSKGTIRFPPSKPLPAALVRKLVKTRIAEYAGKKPVAARRAAKKARASRRPSRGSPNAGGTARVVVENVNVPGSRRSVDAAKYQAMRRAILKVLPSWSPGFTYAEMSRAMRPHLPARLFPGGAKAGWWLKTVQLDLEAKGTIAREKTKPLRWRVMRRR